MTAVAPQGAVESAGFDVRRAIGAGRLLGVFNAAGVLSSADVHVAQRLGRLCGETDERALLAVALTVRAVRSGSVCVRLDDLDTLAAPEVEDVTPLADLPWPDPATWQSVVCASPVVAVGATGPDRPARWVDGRLYLDRYWRDEQVVRSHVVDRLGAGAARVDTMRLSAACHRVFDQPQDDRQRLAAAAAVLSRLTVLTGGPGTGKTTTVARVLAVLHESLGSGLRVALAAPTGKAAARLQEAVREVVAEMGDADRRRVGLPEATTVHRLLGWRAGSSTRFRHDGDHHLPHDVVVVDETSMVSLPLMARLLEAMRPQARLVLVGDPDQLASVEAGAVLGDLVARTVTSDALPSALASVLPDDVPTDPAVRSALRAGVVRLEVVHRHGAVIGALAAAIRAGDADETLRLLRAGEPRVTFVETVGDVAGETELSGVRQRAEEAGVALVAAARAGDVPGALAALESHRVLVAHRRGPAGVAHWALLVEEWVDKAWAVQQAQGEKGPDNESQHGGYGDEVWYPGRPLLVTRNDRDTGLFNGDTGVVVAAPTAGVVAAFGDPARPLLVRPHRLPSVETVHAMTVHRAQGSQFAEVSLVLPAPTSPLLTRELLYTAVTRAREAVCVVGTADAVRAAVQRPVRRASGLRDS
jgi:exodeoxyribonuclease V alpha subunit